MNQSWKGSNLCHQALQVVRENLGRVHLQGRTVNENTLQAVSVMYGSVVRGLQMLGFIELNLPWVCSYYLSLYLEKALLSEPLIIADGWCLTTQARVFVFQ